MNWLYVLAAGVVISLGSVVVVRGLVDEARSRTMSVPEPVPPVILLEAYRQLGSETKAVHLQDAAGHEFDLRLTMSEEEVHDDRHNRLNWLVGDERRLVDLHSSDERRLKRALRLAIEYRRAHPVLDTASFDAIDRPLMYAEAALERFGHLGKPWPY